MLNWLFSFGPDYRSGSPLTPSLSAISAPPPSQNDERLHNLELACAALWELLKQQNGYTDQQLKDHIGQISQHRQQASPTAGVETCPKCHHKMLTNNHTKCLWCGVELPPAPFKDPSAPL